MSKHVGKAALRSHPAIVATGKSVARVLEHEIFADAPGTLCHHPTIVADGTFLAKATNQATCFIQGVADFNIAPLFIRSWNTLSPTNGLNLVIPEPNPSFADWSPLSITGDGGMRGRIMNLFVRQAGFHSTTVPLFIWSIVPPTSIHASLTPLLIGGKQTFTIGPKVPLIISSPTPIHFQTTLHIATTNHIDGVTVPLFMRQDRLGIHAKLNLVVKAKKPIRVNKQRTLFIQGWDSVLGDDPTSRPIEFAHSVNLFVDGVGEMSHPGGNSAVMNLFVQSIGDGPIGPRTPHFTEDGTTLVVVGYGSTPGIPTAAKPMNLYIERGTHGGTTLFLMNEFNESGILPQSIPLVIGSDLDHETVSGVTPLIVVGLGGTTTGQTTLSLPAVSTPQEIDQDITLVIPKVVGELIFNLPLYIHGWSP